MITRTSSEEFEKITVIWEASVRASHHFLPEEDILYFRPLVRDTYLGLVDLWVYRNEHKNILAFLGVAEGKIEMLFVQPDQFGKGIGKTLLRYAIENLNCALVDVNEQNPMAVEFYKRQGFEVIDRSPLDPQGKPYPILHMKLK